jgi:hypothetical protein
MKINPFQRYQSGLNVEDLFPLREDNTCGCGCGVLLVGRKKRWATKDCLKKSLRLFWVVKGDTKEIRKALFQRDGGACAVCGEMSLWDADHVVPVHRGGGACDLDNFQTLCLDCHRTKNNAETLARLQQKVESSAHEFV